MSQAGALVRNEAIGHWWDVLPRERWPDDAAWRANLKKNWHEVWGDRRQEIVFIGRDMDEAWIRRELDACLLGSDEKPRFDWEEWDRLRDPFPIWQSGAAA